MFFKPDFHYLSFIYPVFIFITKNERFVLTLSMEEALLAGGERVSAPTWRLFVEELKKVSYIAAPMVVVTVSQTLSRVASMMMVGQLGELALSGAAVATSLAHITGLSLLFGMASALETLCGQAFGAGQYKKLGTYTYASIICLLVVSLPISLLWIFMDRLLIFIGQDPSISIEAGKYATWLIPALFPYAILQSLIRYLQTQSLILPMLWSSVSALIFHVPVCWILVFKLELGIAGAAVTIGLSYWFNVILLVLYVKFSSTCKKTRAPFCKDILPSMREFSGLAVPSAVMVCLEWWSCEIIVLLSGLLPNPQLETSVLSICLLVGSLHYFIPYSIGAAASTRVSNELGAGCPDRARASVWAANVLSIAEAIVACTILLCCRRFLGYAFSNEKEVVDYLGDMTPFVCLLLAMDCIQAVLSGVARGSGWQHVGAYVNLGSYYLVGLPIAVVLGFVLHLRGKGLWLGLNMGSIVQSILLSLVTCSMNWKKQASMARQRMFEGTMAADDNEKSLT
uniref:Protein DETOXIFICATION n=1 Tax=Rehmannia glutinosa TaxID=99300 RepID=A0A482EV59_REHGL|nr:MATE59 [Rehmannia glutinosa]